MSLKLNIAKKMIEAAIAQAENWGLFCSIAVVDDQGFLVALYRMDKALIPTADIARDKAWTAAVFRMPSSDIAQKFGDPMQPGGGFGRQNWNDRLTTIPGGLPIKTLGKVIGGIGISGGNPREDVLICEAALGTLGNIEANCSG
ncbi:MAG: GlcG/HbpS family heme-binding protein [Dethiobacteria bacterium]